MEMSRVGNFDEIKETYSLEHDRTHLFRERTVGRLGHKLRIQPAYLNFRSTCARNIQRTEFFVLDLFSLEFCVIYG